MWDKFLEYIWANHRGKTIGLLLGLLVSILFVSFGFWKTLFIVFCIAAGYIIGKSIDEETDFDNWINRFKGGR